MKAFLLAAGIGSRLRPITDTMPKCMVTIDDRPLLDIWLDAFDRAGVDEVLVNLHHLPDVVRRHVAARTGPPTVRLVFEPELLGSAGTLRRQPGLGGGRGFLPRLQRRQPDRLRPNELIDVHRAGGAVATLTASTRRTRRPAACLESTRPAGSTGFTEKPPQPASDLVNAGMYAFSPACLTRSPASRPPTSDMTSCRG